MTSQEIIIWGKHPLELALQSKWVDVQDIKIDSKDYDTVLKSIQPFLKGKRVSIKSTSRSEIEKTTQTEKHQNVAARIKFRTFDSIKEWADEQKESHDKPWLGIALDEVQDPQNVGTLLRAANFFGADFVLMTRDRASPLTGVVVKASAGGIFSLPVIRAVNLSRELNDAQDLNFWKVGLDADAEKVFSTIKLGQGHVLLVLGNEGKGLRPLTAKNCDELAKLNRIGSMESLNVAVAGAISLYEVSRQRTNPKQTLA